MGARVNSSEHSTVYLRRCYRAFASRAAGTQRKPILNFSTVESVGITAAILTSLRMERADDLFGGPEGSLTYNQR